MARHILETRRQVSMAIIRDYAGGRECAAARLGMTVKTFDNHAYQNNGSRSLSDEEIFLLEQDAKTTHLPDYVAAMYGGIFVPLMSPEQHGKIDLYANALESAIQRGRVDELIALALEDGVITGEEIAQIMAAHRKSQAAREAEVRGVITLHATVEVNPS